MDLKNLKVQELNAQEVRGISGGGDLIRLFWYYVGKAGAAYGNAIQNEINHGGSVLNWKY